MLTWNCLLINRIDTIFYRNKNKKKYVKGYGYSQFTRNLKDFEEIIIPPEKREEILNELR